MSFCLSHHPKNLLQRNRETFIDNNDDDFDDYDDEMNADLRVRTSDNTFTKI